MVVKLDPDIPTKDFMQKVAALKRNPFVVGIRRVLLGIKDKVPQRFIENLQILGEDKDVQWPFDVCIDINELPAFYEVYVCPTPYRVTSEPQNI